MYASRICADKPDSIGSLKAVCTNIRSIENNFHELGVSVEDLSPTIVAITQTWLISNIEDTPELCGFICLLSDRVSGRKGGGVALYINNSLHVRSWKSEAHESGTSEIVSCEITFSTGTLLTGVLYRSPYYQCDDFTLVHLK